MTYVRSHTFCFCIPVRFGVFILSTLFFLGGGIIAASGWYGAMNKGTWHVSLPKIASSLSSYRTYTPDQESRDFYRDNFNLIHYPCYRFPLWVSSLFAVYFRAAQCSYYDQVDWNHHQASDLRLCVQFDHVLPLRIQHCNRRVLYLYPLP